MCPCSTFTHPSSLVRLCVITVPNVPLAIDAKREGYNAVVLTPHMRNAVAVFPHIQTTMDALWMATHLREKAAYHNFMHLLLLQKTRKISVIGRGMVSRIEVRSNNNITLHRSVRQYVGWEE